MKKIIFFPATIIAFMFFSSFTEAKNLPNCIQLNYFVAYPAGTSDALVTVSWNPWSGKGKKLIITSDVPVARVEMDGEDGFFTGSVDASSEVTITAYVGNKECWSRTVVIDR